MTLLVEQLTRQTVVTRDIVSGTVDKTDCCDTISGTVDKTDCCDTVSGTVDSQTVVTPSVEQLVMCKLVTDRVEHISAFIHVP